MGALFAVHRAAAEDGVEADAAGDTGQAQGDQALLGTEQAALGVEYAQEPFQSLCISLSGEFDDPLRGVDDSLLRGDLLVDRAPYCERIGHVTEWIEIGRASCRERV